MRITNIDTLSALLDRLITERIKWYFFKKENNRDAYIHQETIIREIQTKLCELFLEINETKQYKYSFERRTFANNIIESLDQLIISDIHIGESDRARLEFIMAQEKRLRKANETRSEMKNKIDEAMLGLT
jgi:hypothetical protein